MDHLEYEEILRMKVSCFCPNITGTIEKQEDILDPPGMTLIGFIKTKRNFNQLNKQLMIINRGFRPAPNPHLILLGLFSGNREFTKEHENKIHEMISKFFDSRMIKKFRIKFDQVRPGRAFDIKHNPIPSISNGTVFARAHPCDCETQRFQALGEEQKSYLEERSKEPFKLDLDRPYPTVWCTLGYFSQTFEVDSEVKSIFDEYKDFRKEVTIRSFCLVRYKNRKLPINGLKIIEQYPLK